MRYTLRNRNKIETAFGSEFLRWLILSLNEHFKNNEIITPDPNYVNQPYPIILVNNVQPKTDSTFELYIIEIKYDVYRLAYKSCMS